MTDADLTELVRTYFAAVDAKDLRGVLVTLTKDCVFTVETHGVRLQGHGEISGMFHRLWDRHAAVLHDGFIFVPCAATGRIAAQFRVTNTLPDGGKVFKSNCNFFRVKGGAFDRVSVYMAGENTLTGDQ